MDRIEDYIEEYGEPIFRQEIDYDVSEQDRLFAGIPQEVAVFKIDHPTGLMVVGKLLNDEWRANFGERTVIKALLKREGV